MLPHIPRYALTCAVAAECIQRSEDLGRCRRIVHACRVLDGLTPNMLIIPHFVPAKVPT